MMYIVIDIIIYPKIDLFVNGLSIYPKLTPDLSILGYIHKFSL
jgi:hypothetical protein